MIREQHEPLRPDGLYPIPYPLNYGTSTDSQGNNTKYLLPNFASNVAHSFSVRLEDHGFNSGWATTTIRLTPSLAEEEVRHLARQVYRTGCVANEIAVGISHPVGRTALWLTAERFLCRLSRVASSWLLTARVGVRIFQMLWRRSLTRSRKSLLDSRMIPGRKSRFLAVSSPHCIWALEQLHCPERQATAAVTTESLDAQGRKLRYLGNGSFGPDLDKQPVPQWHDDETDLRFSLIPGGEFFPASMAPC